MKKALLFGSVGLVVGLWVAGQAADCVTSFDESCVSGGRASDAEIEADLRAAQERLEQMIAEQQRRAETVEETWRQEEARQAAEEARRVQYEEFLALECSRTLIEEGYPPAIARATRSLVQEGAACDTALRVVLQALRR